VFDPQEFAERGTTACPAQTAIGMRAVLVNGILVLNNGQVTGARSGQVLRHRKS
jgi:N-acyl-D-amino-acid deacylase